MLEDIKPTDPKVPHEHRLIKGEPADAIARAAELEKVDMIVMGTHGRSGVSRLLMGSVAEAVVRRASPPGLLGIVGRPRHNRILKGSNKLSRKSLGASVCPFLGTPRSLDAL